jgi:hypothetical protein
MPSSAIPIAAIAPHAVVQQQSAKAPQRSQHVAAGTALCARGRRVRGVPPPPPPSLDALLLWWWRRRWRRGRCRGWRSLSSDAEPLRLRRRAGGAGATSAAASAAGALACSLDMSSSAAGARAAARRIRVRHRVSLRTLAV